MRHHPFINGNVLKLLIIAANEFYGDFQSCRQKFELHFKGIGSKPDVYSI